jgi:hypothetical protein
MKGWPHRGCPHAAQRQLLSLHRGRLVTAIPATDASRGRESPAQTAFAALSITEFGAALLLYIYRYLTKRQVTAEVQRRLLARRDREINSCQSDQTRPRRQPRTPRSVHTRDTIKPCGPRLSRGPPARPKIVRSRLRTISISDRACAIETCRLCWFDLHLTNLRPQ